MFSSYDSFPQFLPLPFLIILFTQFSSRLLATVCDVIMFCFIWWSVTLIAYFLFFFRLPLLLTKQNRLISFMKYEMYPLFHCTFFWNTNTSVYCTQFKLQLSMLRFSYWFPINSHHISTNVYLQIWVTQLTRCFTKMLMHLSCMHAFISKKYIKYA